MDENPYKSPENAALGCCRVRLDAPSQSRKSRSDTAEYVPSALLESGCWILCGILAVLAFGSIPAAILSGAARQAPRSLAVVLGLFVMLLVQVVITFRIHRERNLATWQDGRQGTLHAPLTVGAGFLRRQDPGSEGPWPIVSEGSE